MNPTNNRLSILERILLLIERYGDVRKLTIALETGLSYTVVDENLLLMVGSGLLICHERGIYKATRKGSDFLKTFRELEDMVDLFSEKKDE